MNFRTESMQMQDKASFFFSQHYQAIPSSIKTMISWMIKSHNTSVVSHRDVMYYVQTR